MPFGPNLNLSPLCKNIFFRFWQKRDTNIQIQRGLFVKMYFPKCTLGSPAGSTSPKPLKSGIPRFHLQQREIELNFQFGISKYKRWKPKWFAQCEAKQCMEKMAAGSPKPPQMVSSPSPLVSTVALEQRRGELLRGLATPTLQPPSFDLDFTSRQAGMPYVLVRSSTNWSNFYFAPKPSHQMLVTCQWTWLWAKICLGFGQKWEKNVSV